ncbi:hypothetical protein [Novosphingobium terrae]|uniref:hypothetical protein n=1 Tax=Novosphingobium terrae TaxID=2726189 RepID=UPI00198151FA|nr:hypothetical protein [Novosphingobium terrae]
MSRLDPDALLASGGDERLALDPASGLNIYGYGVVPRPGDLAMGSSTASTISAQAREALAASHAPLMEQVRRDGEEVTYRTEVTRLSGRLHALLGVDGANADVLFSPSGTDLHLLATTLLAGATRSLLTITLEGSETGSGVVTAAGGRHFMSQAPDGSRVAKGMPLEEVHQSLSLPVRDDTGALIPSIEIERQLDLTIGAAIRAGRDCLLVTADVTKTGLIAPDLDTVFRLKARYGDRLWIMVDACQLRISPATIRAYLARGMMVAITGSKFMGGPIFSGALLCPPPVARPLSAAMVPAALGAYFGQDDVPEGWAMRRHLPRRANLGLLLRWQAALFEWEQLQALGGDDVAQTIQSFATAVTRRLTGDAAFEPIATRPLDRGALQVSQPHKIDTTPTIFPFLLARLDGAGRRAGWLDRDETRLVYDHLASGKVASRSIRLGQPVACGARGGVPVSALRLCLSARLIVDCCGKADGMERLAEDAMLALDGAAQAARDLAVATPLRKSA